MSLRARLLLIIGVPLAMIATLAVAGLLWWRWDTARQPKVGSDVPVMDRALGDAVAAAGQQAPLAVSALFQGARCDLGPLRDGGRFTRGVDLYTGVGGEAALIDRIAAGLPAAYQPQRGAAAGTAPAPLTATAGPGVQLTVRRISPGWVVARARTDCTTGESAGHPPVDIAATPARDAVDNVLSALGAQAAGAVEERLLCPGGWRTVSVSTRPADGADLSRRLRDRIPSDARPVVSPTNRVAYRTATASVVVAPSDDNTAVMIQHTSRC